MQSLKRLNWFNLISAFLGHDTWRDLLGWTEGQLWYIAGDRRAPTAFLNLSWCPPGLLCQPTAGPHRRRQNRFPFTRKLLFFQYLRRGLLVSFKSVLSWVSAMYISWRENPPCLFLQFQRSCKCPFSPLSSARWFGLYTVTSNHHC